MGDVPWIISVDDHIVEPPDVFQARLPAKFREQGPKVVRLPWQAAGGFRAQGISPATSGPETDFWHVEDIHLAIPKVEVAAGMPPEEVVHEPISFEQMRPGCYRIKDRLRDMDAAKIERSLCFPNSHAICRTAVPLVEGQRAGPGMRPSVQRLHRRRMGR